MPLRTSALYPPVICSIRPRFLHILFLLPSADAGLVPVSPLAHRSVLLDAAIFFAGKALVHMVEIFARASTLWRQGKRKERLWKMHGS